MNNTRILRHFSEGKRPKGCWEFLQERALRSGSSGPGANVDWSALKFLQMAAMAALSEYENAMFLELMDDDGLFVTAK